MIISGHHDGVVGFKDVLEPEIELGCRQPGFGNGASKTSIRFDDSQKAYCGFAHATFERLCIVGHGYTRC